MFISVRLRALATIPAQIANHFSVWAAPLVPEPPISS
jgi:hypothetical protein